MAKSIYTLAREKTVERSKKFSCEFVDEVKKNRDVSYHIDDDDYWEQKEREREEFRSFDD